MSKYIDFAKSNPQRIAVAEKGGDNDQVPVISCIASNWIPWWFGIKTKKYFFDPGIMLASQLKASERFYSQPKASEGFYGGSHIFPDFGVITEPESMGAKIVWPEDDAPWALPFIQNPEEDIEKVIFPPKLGKIMQRHIEYYTRWRKKGYSPTFYPAIGPMDTAAMLRGFNNLMLDLYERPKFVHRLMDMCTEVMIMWVKKQEEVAGGTLPGNKLIIGDDLPGMIGPNQFKEFVIPYIKKFYNAFSSNYVHYWHCDATEAINICELLPQAGIDVFYAFSWRVNLGELRKKLGNSFCLAGGVSTMTLLHGTPEEVKKNCYQAIKEGGTKAFILCTGGEVIRETPPENLDAIFESAIKYGKE